MKTIRLSTTVDSGGAHWAPQAGSQEFRFEIALDEIQAQNEAYLDELQAAGLGPVQKFGTAIDPAQVRLVAFLRNPYSGDTLGALAHEPARPEDEEEGFDG